MITIEPLHVSDLVAVAQCIAIDTGAFPYASTSFGLRSRTAVALVARTDAEPRVVGFVAAVVRANDLCVEGLAVDTSMRRRGIGRALVQATKARGRALGLRAILLNTSVGNLAAIALYESEGFVVRRRVVDFYARVEGGPDAYEMVCVLGRDRSPRSPSPDPSR